MFIAVIRTVILYVFVILAIRLMGKRQISDMQPSELVVTMMISDIASLPMQNTAQPLLSGVVPVLVLVSLELTVSAVMLKSRLFRKLISGSPVVVIEDGRLLQRQLKRLRLTTDELCAQLRQQNVFSLQDVQYCIVETNGVLSVLEKPSKRVPKWVESSLRLCGSTKQEINNILQKKQIELNEIFLMTMDGNGVCQIIRRENEK